MERRLLLAIVLMVGVMILSNVLFPPVERVVEPGPSAEPAGAAGGAAGAGAAAGPEGIADTGAADAASALSGVRDSAEARALDFPSLAAEAPGGAAPDATAAPEGAAGGAADAGRGVVTVRSELYEYRFDPRGAALVGATMLDYENFAEGSRDGAPVELVRAGDRLFGYGVVVRGDSVSLDDIAFAPSATEIEVIDEPRTLRFEAAVGRVTFDVAYTFHPDDYRIDATGGVRGLEEVGHAVLVGLGRGMEWNEAVRREDRDAMALVTRGRTGDIEAERLGGIDVGEARVAPGAPFSWVASKSKYWLAALVVAPDRPGIGGVTLRGIDEEAGAEMRAALPLPAGSDGFAFTAYAGPQDFARLQAVGQELHNVNPYGWSWLRWFIVPFGNLIVAVLIWMHQSFALAYGWVLVAFGVASRIALFPLYQISMRQQMKQMALQPEMQRLKERYKDDPQRHQQEQVKLFREHGVNPLGGCLPMLLPFPILITLFFVFQNTIEFRGVPFMWLPDLSLHDPLYIVPILMGGSMLLLNWIGQRGMETNAQMKMFSYALPVVFTFFFARFAAGLNLYYTASNFASLPQQMYLSRERRKNRAKVARADSIKDAVATS